MAAVHELLDAIRTGDEDGVRAVLEREPSAASARGDAGESPILIATYHGRRELLPLLAEHTTPDAFESLALGNVARVRSMVESDAGLLRAHSFDGWPLLHLAGFFGNREIAESLLEAGAEVDALSGNYMQNSALHATLAGSGDIPTAHLLLDRGAGPNVRGASGYTPLMIAASRGNTVMVERLLALGADPSATADDGKTAMEIATERGFPELAERLGKE
jgi:ankyrin repeat protein